MFLKELYDRNKGALRVVFFTFAETPSKRARLFVDWPYHPFICVVLTTI